MTMVVRSHGNRRPAPTTENAAAAAGLDRCDSGATRSTDRPINAGDTGKRGLIPECKASEGVIGGRGHRLGLGREASLSPRASTVSMSAGYGRARGQARRAVCWSIAVCCVVSLLGFLLLPAPSQGTCTCTHMAPFVSFRFVCLCYQSSSFQSKSNPTLPSFPIPPTYTLTTPPQS